MSMRSGRRNSPGECEGGEAPFSRLDYGDWNDHLLSCAFFMGLGCVCVFGASCVRVGPLNRSSCVYIHLSTIRPGFIARAASRRRHTVPDESLPVRPFSIAFRIREVRRQSSDIFVR